MVIMETIKIYIKIYTANMENISDDIKNILHNKEYEYWHFNDSQTNLVFDSIKQKIKMELNLDPNMYTFYYNLNDNPPSFDIENTNLLYQEFSQIYNGKLAFYISVDKTYHNTLLDHLNIERGEDSSDEEVCPVCLEIPETNNFLNQYTCSHKICMSCYHECISHQRYTCSLCRAPNLLQHHYILT